MGLIFHCEQKSSYLCKNCGPLSETNSHGTSSMLTVSVVAVINVSTVVVGSSLATGYRLK